MCRIFLFLLVFLCASTAQAEVPQELNYNGFLTNAVGEAVHCPDAIQCTDTYGFAFSLYADEDSTEVLWQESHFAVPIYGGSFMIPLGSVNGLSEEVLSEARYVGININGGVELTPRQAIASAPFALLAQTAENSLTAGDAQSLGGLEAGTYATLDDLAALQDGLNPIATQGLPADLADGDADSLAGFVCAEGMILQANASGAWVCAVPPQGGGGSTFSGDYNDLSNIPPDDDTLGALTCATGQIPKWEGSGWVCGVDIDTDTTIEDTTIENTTLSEAEVDAMVANNGYAAQTGLDLEKSDREGADLTLQGNLNVVQASLSALDASLHPIATAGLPADLVDGDDDSLASLACADGEVPIRSGAVWICGAAPAAPTGSLMSVLTEPAGANCASGGVRIDQGLDDDTSGTLDTAEVDTIHYVCNGAAAAGAGGGGTAVSFGTEPPENCTAAALEQQYFDTTLGGYRTCNGQLWIPDISTCGNSVLQPGEECDDGNSLLSDGCHQCLQLGPALCAEACHETQSMQIYHPAPILLASDGESSDHFGYNVAISGDTLVVGSHYDDDMGSNSGSAHVFVRSGSNWVLQQKLTDSGLSGSDYFGYSVAIDGDTLAIGAIGDDDHGSQSGAVYVFTRSGNVWLMQQKLSASDGAGGDEFGHSVAISGETLVAGSIYDDDSGQTNSGSAYVFVRLGGVVWNQQTKLHSDSPSDSDYFGWDVAIDGDIIVVGAPYGDDKGTNSGSTEIFRRIAGIWTHDAKLVASDGSNSHYMGWSTAVSGNTMVSSSYYADRVYVYVYSGSSWSLQQMLKPGQGSGYYGHSVAIDGDIILIGTPRANPKGSQSGAAYVYNRTGSTWVEQHYVANPDGNADDHFGYAVDVDGDYILMGSVYDDDLGGDSGSAQVFSIQPYCTTQGVCICEFGYGGDDCGTVL